VIRLIRCKPIWPSGQIARSRIRPKIETTVCSQRTNRGQVFLKSGIKKQFRNFFGASPLKCMGEMMNVEFLKEQVERCRRLAKEADTFTEKRLMALAAEYEARIAEMEKGYRPSFASQRLNSHG
jgi:hypothetical protein